MQCYHVHAVKISKDIALKSWQTKWNCELSGSYTRQLIPEVGVKIYFREEDIGISYLVMICEQLYFTENADKRVNYVQDVLPGWKCCVQSYLYTEI